jgi:hypothetical protein
MAEKSKLEKGPMVAYATSIYAIECPHCQKDVRLMVTAAAHVKESKDG